MNQSLLSPFGSPLARVDSGLRFLQQGKGVLVVDDEHRENEGYLIFSAQHLTTEQMAMLIRDCSGIVCLCLEEAKIRALELPMMCENNQSAYQTAFTVSIEAARGVTTGVSAADRVTTVKSAIAQDACSRDLVSPGHIFPLRAQPGGVLARRGHTEATVDLMKLAGLQPCGVLCEVTNPDGTMARLPEIVDYGLEKHMPVLTVEDIAMYRSQCLCAEGDAASIPEEKPQHVA